jgi:plasmid maintenance system antidote protein VapI
MSSFKEIKKRKRDVDYELVADALGLSKATIRSIVNERRGDKHHVLVAFDILFRLREIYTKLVQQYIEGELKEEVEIKFFDVDMDK